MIDKISLKSAYHLKKIVGTIAFFGCDRFLWFIYCFLGNTLLDVNTKIKWVLGERKDSLQWFSLEI